jgi:hypothetical protein
MHWDQYRWHSPFQKTTTTKILMALLLQMQGSAILRVHVAPIPRAGFVV